MYIVDTAYDDNTAIILDLGTYTKQLMSEKELINFGNKHDVLGLSIGGKKINYISSYSCISFPTETEANEYIKDNKLSYKNKRSLSYYTLVLEKKNCKIHVDYFICCYAGDEVTYVTEKGYTQYIEGAKAFDKKTAKEQAVLMTKKSTTGKYWTTKRVTV